MKFYVFQGFLGHLLLPPEVFVEIYSWIYAPKPYFSIYFNNICFVNVIEMLFLTSLGETSVVVKVFL